MSNKNVLRPVTINSLLTVIHNTELGENLYGGFKCFLLAHKSPVIVQSWMKPYLYPYMMIKSPGKLTCQSKIRKHIIIYLFNGSPLVLVPIRGLVMDDEILSSKMH